MTSSFLVFIPQVPGYHLLFHLCLVLTLVCCLLTLSVFIHVRVFFLGAVQAKGIMSL